MADALDSSETESGAQWHWASFLTEIAGRIRWFAERQVAQSRQDAELAAAIVVNGDERWILLRDSLMALSLREAGNAVRAAALLVDESPLREALDNLGSEDSAQRAGAIELIDSSQEAGMLRPLIPILEGKDVTLDRPPFAKLQNHHDSWIRRCVEFATTPGDEMARTLATLNLMERVLFLRKVPLFAGLAPQDLERIAEVAAEDAYGDGDTIDVEGDPAPIRTSWFQVRWSSPATAPRSLGAGKARWSERWRSSPTSLGWHRSWPMGMSVF